MKQAKSGVRPAVPRPIVRIVITKAANSTPQAGTAGPLGTGEAPASSTKPTKCITIDERLDAMNVQFCAQARLGLALAMMFSGATMADELPNDIDRALALLTAPDHAARLRASRNMIKYREHVGKEVTAQIERGLKNPDRRYGSSLGFAVLTAGIWRIEESVPLLVDHMDFTFDPQSFPVGARHVESTYYPMALALSRIQGAAVSTRVLDLLRRPGNEKKLRPAVWVLRECVGVDLAKVAVESAIQNAEDQAQRNQLTAARALLDERIILRPPDRAAPERAEQAPMTEGEKEGEKVSDTFFQLRWKSTGSCDGSPHATGSITEARPAGKPVVLPSAEMLRILRMRPSARCRLGHAAATASG